MVLTVTTEEPYHDPPLPKGFHQIFLFSPEHLGESKTPGGARQNVLMQLLLHSAKSHLHIWIKDRLVQKTAAFCRFFRGELYHIYNKE